MDFYGLDRSKALAHCDSLALGRASRDTDSVRTWNRLRPEHIIDLLATASPEARQEARTIAGLMTRAAWRIHMQASTQGKANQLASNVREVGLSVGGRDYRLQLTEGRTLQLERITAA
ncbi:MAG: hypothetical protein ABN502_01940 [Gammaproteobacteria bacterium]|jgi:hypothetical protein|uniref:Uncharacterized protein n=1 Tax=Xanthomonas boreopolis TaxID=86183 RepID=A0A919FCE2_9XANT|nr:hypothetical protein [Pseudomonas sp. Hp2]GHH60831.1 hypothetical protein GCM10009090_36700 [[Pseudomonas] boreopolis]